MVEFYTSIVGLRESDRVNDDEEQMRTSFMRTDSEHHSFAVFQTTECRFDHHCYEVTDWNAIRDWGDRFAELRTPIKWGPGRHGPGNNLFLFIHDPDGNWVEFSAELMVVPDTNPSVGGATRSTRSTAGGKPSCVAESIFAYERFRPAFTSIHGSPPRSDAGRPRRFSLSA